MKLTGLSRYNELLSSNLRSFLIVNFLTLLGFLPFFLGVLYSLLSSSVLILIPSCIIGGIAAGPALSCMYDAIFRSLREAPGGCIKNYKRAFLQNWKQSLIPGILFCLLIGFYTFMLMIFLWRMQIPGFGTIAVYLFGLIIITMFFSLYWPQIALFDQSAKQRFQNCLLFLLRYFFKTLGCALLQIFYWAVIALLFPWSLILLPFLGIWFILFTVNFLLYDTMNEAFSIEEQIAQAFPEQMPFYEDDETWLKRKQKESMKSL